MSVPDRSTAETPPRAVLPAAGAAGETACFSIAARAEPGTLARLIDAFARRSLVPERWHGGLVGDGVLHLDVQVRGLDVAAAEILAAKLRAMVDVDTVLTFRKPA